MNRFSKDMGQIDDMMPACFSDAMSIALQSLIILALSVYANYFSILLSGFCSTFHTLLHFVKILRWRVEFWNILQFH